MLKLWDAGQENTWLATFRVRTPFVPWYDEIDSFGHVSNIVYPRYFEFGRMQYFKTVKDPEPDQGVVFPFAHVIAEQHIRYIDRCFFDEQLTVLSKITEFGRSSATFEQAIIGADGKMRAIATTVVVHRNRHESKQWTASQREAIAAFEGFQSSSVREF